MAVQRMQMLNRLRRSAGSNARIYGHRGARGVLPENTLESFIYLAGLYQTEPAAVEFDIQMTADGELVLIHDPYVPAAHTRDSEGNWLEDRGPKVIETPLETLQSFDIGRARLGTDYQLRYPEQQAVDGARIPTLSEVFDWIKDHPQMLANVEIKSYADRADLSASPERLAQATSNLIEEYGLSEQTLVSSFDWRVLAALKQQSPDLHRGYLTYFERPNPPMQPNIFLHSPWMAGLSAVEKRTWELIADEGGIVWCPHYSDLTQENLAQAHDLGLAVNVWTVNADEEILRLNQIGVDGIITDYPERALALLRM